jgi:hypothetical protein
MSGQGNFSCARAASAVAKGHFSHNGSRKVVVLLDDDTFDEIRDRAVRAGTSFAAQVRMLTEVGLETLKADGQ